ncbi:hypothetical protein [Thalassotalea profundi]|uniref:Uncharacterized protein n=1 Tax=Thalassotalea profundi TaxID=2036687 RepID=A0ABQ3IQ67_9GAMM|nr:hypothetical protein [Thalassotalea profundi]GHE86282.1 hypothetical protein GCM10011501_14250 [Thalassotalea profundi]
MNNQTQKKNEEKRQLVNALRLLNISGLSTIKESESPDFIINIANKAIGIEVTELYIKDDFDSAKTQAHISRISQDAIEIFDKKSNTKCIFHFGFNGHNDASNRKEITTSLSKHLLQNIHFRNKKCTNLINLKIPKNSQFSTLINSIHARPIESNNSEFFITSKFETKNLTKTAISNCIAAKEKLLPKYKKSCQEIWLLIVLPLMQLSNDYQLHEGIPNIKITSDFDKLFVYDEYREKVTIIT